ncbi:MAG: D-glycerate dehydrogenase [Caulobacterales bacterium]|nr:D-glycerate dehydrogenase [Caulobacterales bacterium]
MTRARPRVVVTRKLPTAVETRMSELFDAVLNADDTPLGHDDLIAAAREADVLVPTLTDQIDAAVIAAGGEGRLGLIANFGAGVDHIDLSAAHEHGVVVTNTPGVLTEDTADFAMALILAVARRVTEGAQVVQAGGFSGWSPTWMLGRRLSGKKLGIVGMGRVGQAVARRARAFGLEIHYHNRRKVSPAIEEELGARYWESLGQMLARVDIVSVNCPRTPGTFHLLSRRRLQLMQPHAYVVNTSRGEVVDEEALAELLDQGRIAGAALDVFEREPEINPTLLRLPNVLLAPHMGSATLESRLEMGELALINIRVWQDEELPPNRVFPDDMFGDVL